MQRIAELRKDGLWSAKRLPKVQEPPRNKTHWDYLLEEMQWLAADFAQERRWKKNAARKVNLCPHLKARMLHGSSHQNYKVFFLGFIKIPETLFMKPSYKYFPSF